MRGPSSSTGIGVAALRFGCLFGWHWRSLAAFDGVIVGPEQMRRHTAPGPPRLGELGHALGIGTLPQPKRDARRLLQGKVASRPGIGVAEAEQEIDVGSPRSDAMQRH